MSIGTPPRRSTSRTLRASRTISGPMPSPGRIAIFMRVRVASARRVQRCKSQPRLLAQVARLERANFVGVLERQADVVPAVEEAFLAERIDVEGERKTAIARADALLRSEERRVGKECRSGWW